MSLNVIWVLVWLSASTCELVVFMMCWTQSMLLSQRILDETLEKDPRRN